MTGIAWHGSPLKWCRMSFEQMGSPPPLKGSGGGQDFTFFFFPSFRGNESIIGLRVMCCAREFIKTI